MMSDLSAIALDMVWFYVHSSGDDKDLLASNMVEHIEDILEHDPDSEPMLRVYLDLLKDLLEEKVDVSDQSTVNRLLLKHSHNKYIKRNEDIVDSLKSILSNDKPVASVKLGNIKKRIRNYLVWSKGDRTLRRINSKNWKYGAARDSTKQDIYLNEILEGARELLGIHENFAGTSSTTDTIEFIDMSNTESIRKAMDQYNERNSGMHLKTGLQGLNEMLNGGIKRGELFSFAALTHHYKSGILMSLARWFCMYNKPKSPPNAIPAIVFISLENELYRNLNDWFRAAYTNMYQKEPQGLSDEEVREFVANAYSCNNFRMLVFRYQGDEFGLKEFKDLQTKLKTSGYNVESTIIDYAQLMSITDNEISKAGNKPKAVQNLFESLRDFASNENQAIVTAVTLDGEAEKIAATNPPYVVKKFGAGNIADSKAIKRPLNGLIFMHKQTNHHGVDYLTFAWNKRRFEDPPKLQFFAYRFTEFGIVDDIKATGPTYVTDIYTDDSDGGNKENSISYMF